MLGVPEKIELELDVYHHVKSENLNNHFKKPGREKELIKEQE